MVEKSLIETLIGVVAGLLGVSGFLYQTLKNPNGMTYPMISFVGISLSLWAGYGLVIGNPIIYVPNLIMIGLLIGTVYSKWRKLN